MTKHTNIRTKKIAILGSTGSIGTQALEVIAAHEQEFSVEVLTAGTNADLLIAQAKQFNPNVVVIADTAKYAYVKQALEGDDIKIFAGEEAIADVASMNTVDVVLGALVGYAGLLPVITAIEHGKTVALANKEVLVVAGQLVNALSHKHKANILPVDSEHSAIFQCLAGEMQYGNEAEKLFLTASGGPFRGMNSADLQTVTKREALQHPNWSMGAKVTIDSASLMNKGLEMIEARWLFGVAPQNIEVVVHPQSIIHSAVQFTDGSIKAQMGLPDMKLPIQYALSYPQRLHSDFPRFSFWDYPNLTFEKPDLTVFRNLQLAYYAIEKNGNMPCIMNAANEVAVQKFLHDKISFLAMPDLIEKTMNAIPFVANPTLSDLIQTHAEAIALAQTL
ncbi:MAG: 1-deoxy-D-xylulose-5-phosphate reductoisomerase [Bacteroidales bacterium]|jgi:1-deoxy-D-xylulose-5-phosphate reductoisomerase|nr:1-deoxy-D-xylulose-5-phosphate reductoisomerase [Bacteroidales bacterium]